MLGLEENMKLIMTILKIRGMDNTDTTKKNIRALARTSNMENPSIKIASVEIQNECLQHEFKENEVTVGTQIVKRME